MLTTSCFSLYVLENRVDLEAYILLHEDSGGTDLEKVALSAGVFLPNREVGNMAGQQGNEIADTTFK